MSILVSNLRIGLEEPDQAAIDAACKRLKVSEEQVLRAAVCKKSLDARRRDRISFVVSVAVDLISPETEAAYAASVPFAQWKPYEPLSFPIGVRRLSGPIIIAGFGPAGIFAAHTLARHGYQPVVYERGRSLDQRTQAVDRFWKKGILDEKANVQFGEGGAGTFSDGKLTTRISDSRCGYVLEQFVRHGAPEEILTQAKPHIGTDRLRSVIASLRQEILDLGGEVHFEQQLEEILLDGKRVTGIRMGGEKLPAGCVVLAVGHSARDTFQTLIGQGIAMEGKSFSVGVRVEQLQTDIDRGLYGNLAGHPALPKGEYQLSYREGGRCVYTFCMCPGGYVVPSASSPYSVVTNGMSEHARNGKNANSALVVSVGPEDFGPHPLDGVRFQQELESRAFQMGGENYRAPAAGVREFLVGKGAFHEGKVAPSYALGVTAADFDQLFPSEITRMLRLGLRRFEQKLHGFACGDGILTGPETRTSSPVRILRNDALESVSAAGLYPCGEGAGYAGGIMSAAVDGVRVAQQIMSEYAPC